MIDTTLASPTPLTVKALLADALGDAGFCHNEEDSSGEQATILNAGTTVEDVAEHLAALVLQMQNETRIRAEKTALWRMAVKCDKIAGHSTKEAAVGWQNAAHQANWLADLVR